MEVAPTGWAPLWTRSQSQNYGNSHILHLQKKSEIEKMKRRKEIQFNTCADCAYTKRSSASAVHYAGRGEGWGGRARVTATGAAGQPR